MKRIKIKFDCNFKTKDMGILLTDAMETLAHRALFLGTALNSSLTLGYIGNQHWKKTEVKK